LGADLSCVACRPSQAAPDDPEGASGGGNPELPAGDRRASGIERRDARRQRPVAGGTRLTDPPLTTRACADYMGFSPEWIRQAIEHGHSNQQGLTVRLEAETLTVNGRRLHRIHLDEFIRFLKAYGWKRVPRHPREPAGVLS